MVSVEFSEGITESLDILEHMDRAYIDKIPRKFMEFLENNKSTSYISNLDHSKKLNEMSLKEKTKDLLAILYLKYWCTEQEKSDFSNLLRENEIKYQDELKEKYNVDKIFKNTNPSNKTIKHNIYEDENVNNVAMIEFKESFFKKFINKIRWILKTN